MMPAAAGAAFEVVEGDLVRQLLGGALDPPAILNHPGEVLLRGCLGEIGKEKLRRRRCAGWPFGDQPTGGLRFGSGDSTNTSGCRQEPAHFEPEVRKRAKPEWIYPREISPSRIWALRRSRLPVARSTVRPASPSVSAISATESVAGAAAAGAGSAGRGA